MVWGKLDSYMQKNQSTLLSHTIHNMVCIHTHTHTHTHTDFPDGSVVKNPPAMRKYGFNPWSGRPLGEGKGNPLQYYCLGDLMDSRA